MKRQLVIPLAFVVFGAGATIQLSGSSEAQQTPVYRLVNEWAPLPAGQSWGQVPGVAIDAKGKIFAFRRAEPPIVELDSTGKVLKMWGEQRFVWPHGIRVDGDGFIWVTDGQARDGRGQQVFKLTPDGKVVLTLGTKGVTGDGPDTFNGVCDVAIGNNGDIFVADGHRNARVLKFSKDGTFIKMWGKRGAGPGEFNVPHAIVIDSRGRVLVGDRSNNRIQIFDQDGKYLEQWTQFGTPSGMFLDANDTLYVVDYNVKKGILVGSAKTGEVRFKLDDAVAEGVAVDRDGSIYVGETVPGTTLTGLTGGATIRKLERIK